jgi:hypothetical protein
MISPFCHSGARAYSAFTRVFDALWRANPESILQNGGYGFGARRFAASRNDEELR